MLVLNEFLLIPQYIVLLAFSQLIAVLQLLYVYPVAPKVSLISHPITGKMDIAAIARRAEIIEIVAKSRTANTGGNKMAEVQITAREASSTAGITGISMSFDNDGPTEGPQFYF